MDKKKKKKSMSQKFMDMIGMSKVSDAIKPEGGKDKKKLTPRQKAMRDAMKY